MIRTMEVYSLVYSFLILLVWFIPRGTVVLYYSPHVEDSGWHYYYPRPNQQPGSYG